jgi:YbbR domain-containing protein
LKSWLASLGRNKALKLLSLLLAIALWFAVSGEERTETTLNVTLELVNLPANLMVVSEVPPALQLRVMGPRSLISKLSQSKLTQTLDLSGYKSGPHTFYLGPNSFAFPRGVQIMRIQPNPVSLTLAFTETRALPIKPMLAGNLPEGYELISSSTRPPQVTVKGPSMEIAELKFIPTVPIDLTRLTQPTVVATDLDFKTLHLTLLQPVSILADINVAPKITTRTFLGVPLVAAPKPARLSRTAVSLTLKGPWPRVKELKPEDLKATVDIRNLSPGRYQLKVAVDLPPDVSLVSTNPGSIMVWVSTSP